MKKGLLWWCTAASVGSSHRQCPEAVSFLVHKRPDKAIRPESRAPVMFNCPFRANFLLSVLHLLVLASCAAGRSLIFFAHCCGRRLTKKADQVPLVSEKRTMTRGLYLGSFSVAVKNLQSLEHFIFREICTDSSIFLNQHDAIFSLEERIFSQKWTFLCPSCFRRC